ncbi:LemA family protein [Patescibacteria group bacterium]|nr:LemA family protein [Candidatus Falkowbacteria bacterium]MBU3905610.1 LemA family protein [Patescibacteria group bacterium]MBU4014607.1 LemA family protein [Patescibacteria group bacterium]MBU4026335.1 LemA family protein [Patescibacteria group bacterium]MBU4072819.1 LemA family protein [Patescibacteria group bacterium]
MSTTLLIILGIIVVIALAIIGIYNSLIRLKNRVDEAWSDIDVQLKRRYDLIPNLIETVKGYASHERETLEKVVQARNAAMQAQSGGDAKKQAEAENMLSSTLKSIFALSESYPDLKANTNFLELQRELSDTENKIQASHRFYNGNVRDFNTKLQVFPTNIIADMLKFKAREFFEIEDKKEKENIKVKF